MIAVTGTEMKRIDTYTCQNVTPSIELMERAGRGMAEGILAHYSIKRVLLLCGSSGNGGDAFVVGRYLMEAGKTVDAYLISDKLSPDCETNKNRFQGTIYRELPDLEYDLIVDGLIGFGLKSQLRENYINVIEKVNGSKIPVVSLDIPTGIDATSGISYGAFIRSDYCFTVEYPKTGMFLSDGLDSWRHFEVIPVGIIAPDEVMHINEISDFKHVFPERLRNTNKGSYGKASLIAGSYKYTGASLLAYTALSQFQMGVGYSYLYVPDCLYELYALRHPEIIVGVLPSEDGHIGYDEEELKKVLRNDSIAIGMGMDVSGELYKTLRYLLKNYTGTLILDADALNTLGKYGVGILKDKKCRCILTPHIREMERISGVLVKDILADPMGTAKKFAEEYDVTVILKSASSVITNGKEVHISPFGNTGLAKGGSGDTLSGILSGLSAYLKEDTLKTADLGCYILGRAAELAKEKTPEICMGPLDVSDEIKNVIKETEHE